MNAADAIARKEVRISGQRQITLPMAMYKQFGFGNSAIVSVVEDGILIQPTSNESGDFSDLILRDLVSEGIEGKDLLLAFETRRKEYSAAMLQMLDEARNTVVPEDDFGSLFGVKVS